MQLLRGPRGVEYQFVLALLVAIMVSGGLYAYGALRHHSLAQSYLLWNLFLAMLPLVFALRLHAVLRRKLWSSWEAITWTLLWLLFLPNSFYMISDFIHLSEVPAEHILYSAVLFSSCIFLALILGYCSLYVVHHELRRRLRSLPAMAWIAGTLLICSFAIYIGRDLRWNSWDVIFNPGGLLFDISDRVLRPDAFPTMISTTVSFFVGLLGLYGVIWQAAKTLRQAGAREAMTYLRERQGTAIKRP